MRASEMAGSSSPNPRTSPEGTEGEPVADDDLPTEAGLAELRRRARDGQERIPAAQVFATSAEAAVRS